MINTGRILSSIAIFIFILCRDISCSDVNEVDDVDPCEEHVVVNDPTRNMYYSNVHEAFYCDSSMTGDHWTRFTGSGGSKIPEAAPFYQFCGTETPGWLANPHPEGFAQENVTVCFRSRDDVCAWTTEIQVQRCEGFYVYQLKPTPTCWSRYCTEPDKPPAVLPTTTTRDPTATTLPRTTPTTSTTTTPTVPHTPITTVPRTSTTTASSTTPVSSSTASTSSNDVDTSSAATPSNERHSTSSQFLSRSTAIIIMSVAGAVVLAAVTALVCVLRSRATRGHQRSESKEQLSDKKTNDEELPDTFYTQKSNPVLSDAEIW